MKRGTLDQCEDGDWVEWSRYPLEGDWLKSSQRAMSDFDMDKNNVVHVLEPMEWDFVKAWVCVRKARP